MKIELCAAHLDSLFFADKYNFDRVELCQSLEVGGLTPSLAFQEFSVTHKSFETHVLIRNRAGGFVYSETDKKILLRDMENSVEIGVNGLVVGALDSDRKVDIPFLKQVRDYFPKTELTFHRAFDDVKNPCIEIEKIIDLGFKRILSSGSKKSVFEGIENIQKIISVANNRIEIMLGGGINAQNISEILKTISPNAIHFSGTIEQQIDEDSLFSEKILVPNKDKIEAILKAIKL